MRAAFVLVSALAAVVSAERVAPREPTVTKPARLVERLTGPDIHGACSSVVDFWICAAIDLSPDCWETAADLSRWGNSCACSDATRVYNCHTRYCSVGTANNIYYTGVSVCASKGYGTSPAVPAATGGSNPTGAAAAASSTPTGSNVAANGGSGSANAVKKPNAAPGAKSDLAFWGVSTAAGVVAFVALLA